jgi:hypothetical protein
MSTEIKVVYDNGGKTIDRYTVYFNSYNEIIDGKPVYDCLGMNERPFHPLGFCNHSTGILGNHNGKRIAFEQLPDDCKKAVEQDLN